jgi:hypothetical protein
VPLDGVPCRESASAVVVRELRGLENELAAIDEFSALIETSGR